jgi:hypothetical protein
MAMAMAMANAGENDMCASCGAPGTLRVVAGAAHRRRAASWWASPAAAAPVGGKAATTAREHVSLEKRVCSGGGARCVRPATRGAPQGGAAHAPRGCVACVCEAAASSAKTRRWQAQTAQRKRVVRVRRALCTRVRACARTPCGAISSGQRFGGGGAAAWSPLITARAGGAQRPARCRRGSGAASAGALLRPGTKAAQRASAGGRTGAAGRMSNASGRGVTQNAWRALRGAAEVRPPGAPARGARRCSSGDTQKRGCAERFATHPAAAARRAAHSDGVQLAACMAAGGAATTTTERRTQFCWPPAAMGTFDGHIRIGAEIVNLMSEFKTGMLN